ncbi:kinase-like protein [Panus rudis PR-1116 ss-1]|nr:kinase-like protein [Panus rudis PR-1116 ss-1]
MFEAHNGMPICRAIQVEVMYESQHMIGPHSANVSRTPSIQTNHNTLVPCESLPIPAAYTASLTGSTAISESPLPSTSQIPDLKVTTPLDPAVLTVNRFRPIKRLGRGGFGQVFLVQDKLTNRAYALKAMKKPTNKTWMWNIFEEKMIMQKCQGSPWLLGLKGSFSDRQYAYILMDYQAGGDMYQKWVRCGRRMSVDVMRVYAAGTIYALGELHKRRIIHRDIKLENIFLDDEGDVVLADFGIAKIFGCSAKEKPWEAQAAIEAGLISDIEDIVEHPGFDDLTRSPAGTPGYISPEGLQQRPYSYSSDVWSLGVVFHILLLGRPPFGMVFGKMPASELNEKTLQGILMFTKKDKKSMGVLATDMLTRMLQRDPKERITIAVLKEHPFFEGV